MRASRIAFQCRCLREEDRTHFHAVLMQLAGGHESVAAVIALAHDDSAHLLECARDIFDHGASHRFARIGHERVRCDAVFFLAEAVEFATWAAVRSFIREVFLLRWYHAVMVRLSVNVNKIALLRNSRGGNQPSVMQAARTCLDAGCHGITVHPRPDARHITYKDVRELDAMLRTEYKTEFNIEGYPTPDFLDLVCDSKTRAGDAGARPSRRSYLRPRLGLSRATEISTRSIASPAR